MLGNKNCTTISRDIKVFFVCGTVVLLRFMTVNVGLIELSLKTMYKLNLRK